MNKVDFFSSPIGLGHVTRDIAIAEHFENTSMNFVTGSGASKILKKINLKVHDVYNPPSFIVQNGSLRNPARWLWNYYKYYKECKEISQEIIENDKPDLVISDEDFASLTVAQEMGIPTVLITDVLETRFTKGLASLIEKKMNRSMCEIVRKCDAVIIPEDGENQNNMIRVGPIVRQINHTREELRRRFLFCKKTIVISIGGTDAGVFLIEKTLSAISKISIDVEVVLVSGPSLDKKFGDVKNLGFVENLHEIIFASDLIISLAGKSTIDEANAYGTPAIFIPIKGHFEQEDNAREQGFTFEDINRLDKLILEKLEEKREQSNADGAKKASDTIKKMMKW